MKEIYVPIKGYEGSYLISNMGNVKSVPHPYRRKERMLKPWVNARGYVYVDLGDRSYQLHRLVALHFIPNPYGKETVNHKNENKRDNRVENLEWMTHAENHNYGTRNMRVGKALEKPIFRISKESGQVLQRYPCLKAAVADGYNHSSVSRCANGKGLKSSGGFCWEWE